jgi:hypothetical protein
MVTTEPLVDERLRPLIESEKELLRQLHDLAVAGERERLRLKLRSPFDSANTVSEKLAGEYGAKLELLSEDAAKIARIEQ